MRGKSRSRALSAIVKEARGLVDSGFKEIVLCGICLGSYGKDLNPRLELSDCIEALEGLDGNFRIRLSSIEAQDINSRLIEKFTTSVMLCPHLHIPMQSGDDEILRSMKRKYLTCDYKNLVDNLKRVLPAISITTDIMVGFPAEEEDNFQNTVKFLEYIRPSRMHIFPYSPRRGTSAYGLKNKISNEIVRRRKGILLDLSREFSFSYRKQFIGKVLSVLVESKPDTNTKLLKGYSGNYIPILFAGPRQLINQIVLVRVERLEGNLTFGSLP